MNNMGSRFWTDALFVGLLGLAHLTLTSLFNSHLPLPYMDELFHVNQTREYCAGHFERWNPMITTPPLLYLLASSLGFCFKERFFNSLLFPLCACALLAYRRLTGSWEEVRLAENGAARSKEQTKSTARRKRSSTGSGWWFKFVFELVSSLDPEDVGQNLSAWTDYADVAAVVALPVLLQTSCLFYTDLLSLTLVIYGLSLAHSPTRAALAFAFACLTRQTNIIWAAFYCANNLLSDLDANNRKQDERQVQAGQKSGKVPNGRHELVWITVKCVARHWAFALLGLGFAVFLYWNDLAVVLGDKSAHEPVVHVPQLLYFLLFLLLSCPFLALAHLVDCLRSLKRHWMVFTVVALLALLSIYRFTLAHPYLLADNRHFTFYFWRRWMLRHDVFRYLLLPVYLYGLALLHNTSVGGLPRLALFMVCTAAQLVPAHLLECRYFIVPWTLWRLQLPAAHPSNTKKCPRLLDLLASLVLNSFCTFLFLYRPFRWPHEPEHLQRFMW